MPVIIPIIGPRKAYQPECRVQPNREKGERESPRQMSITQFLPTQPRGDAKFPPPAPRLKRERKGNNEPGKSL